MSRNMRKPKRGRPGKRKRRASLMNSATDFALHSEFAHLKKHVEKLWEYTEKTEERLQDIEIHVNLLTRLLTTLCIEKFGMRIGVLKRLIKRVETEAIRDSQILHLESLYKLPHQPDRKGQAPHSSSKNDPWEEIS